MPSLSLSGQSKQRQIVFLAVGGVLLAGLLLFQVPRTLEMLKGEEPLPPPTETTATPTPVSPVSPVAPPGATPTPVDGSESTPAHFSLTRFRSKDPFVQQINAGGGSAAPSESSPAPAESEAGSEAGGLTAAESSPSSTGTANTATIAVNGTEETVSVSSTFPEGNPVFTLVSLSGETARVGVASGTLRGGGQSVTLSRGEPLTLLNTVDGKRYRLELVSVGS